MPADLATHFPGTTEYVTLIRDPVARTVSEYHYLRQHKSNPAFLAVSRLSLLDFVATDYAFSRNCYARWLSNAAFGKAFPTEEGMLNAAMDNLRQFSFIGITERFEIAIRRLCEKYDLATHAGSEQNRNRSTPLGIRISMEERSFIQQQNSLDMIIYEHCIQRLRSL